MLKKVQNVPKCARKVPKCDKMCQRPQNNGYILDLLYALYSPLPGSPRHGSGGTLALTGRPAVGVLHLGEGRQQLTALACTGFEVKRQTIRVVLSINKIRDYLVANRSVFSLFMTEKYNHFLLFSAELNHIKPY